MQVARKYFCVSDHSPRSTVFHADARDFVAEARNRTSQYDIIFLDCYVDEDIMPDSLMEYGFLHDISRIIAADGVFAINFYTPDLQNDPYDEVLCCDSFVRLLVVML